MKSALFVLCLVFTMAQTPIEPPEYPEGAFCTPQGDYVNGKQTYDHACACHRVDHDPNCDGTPIEHSVCLQFCHPRHCRCPVHCEIDHHPRN